MTMLEAAENIEAIVADLELYCPVCGEKQYAPYDKLFTRAYEECPDCNSDIHEEYVRKGSNILRLLE